MINSLRGKIVKDIALNGFSKQMPRSLHKRALFLLMTLSDASNFEDLKNICEPPSLKLHKLKGSMKDYWSITIGKPWCLIFKYLEGEFSDVEIGDYHD